MPNHQSTALPAAYIVLRILIVLNWIYGVCILALLFVTPNRDWVISALNLAGGPDAEGVIWALRAVSGRGLIAVPINYAVLKRLQAMVVPVRKGDPFVPTNAYRLNAIAWLL